MDVVFLGYADYDFDTSDGGHVDGVKFFYYFPSKKSNYSGFESAGIFVPRVRSDLINQIRACAPGNHYRLNMEYDGRKAVFSGLSAIKAG